MNSKTNVVDFKQAKKEIDSKIEKAWVGIRETCQEKYGVLELPVDEWIALKLLIEMFLDCNPEDSEDFTCIEFKSLLKTILYKIDNEVSVYED